MTTDEALRQALAAMRCAVPTGTISINDWYAAIRAAESALAAPAEEQPIVAWWWRDIDGSHVEFDKPASLPQRSSAGA